MTYALGKRPARPGAIRFSLASYVDFKALPKPPAFFRHLDPPPFSSFANEDYGTCVFASFANLTALWHHEGGQKTEFTTANVISDYSAVTGFDPAHKETDKGTDVADASRYWRHTGIISATGKRDRIDAYAALDIGDLRKLKAAMWMLGGIGIGFRMPDYGMDAFDRGEVWDARWSWGRALGFGDTIIGGHFVPGIGVHSNGNLLVVSWGKVTQMTPRFYLRFADEVVCYLDLGRLDRIKRTSPEGFDEQALRRDLAALARGPVYARSPSGFAI